MPEYTTEEFVRRMNVLVEGNKNKYPDSTQGMVIRILNILSNIRNIKHEIVGYLDSINMCRSIEDVGEACDKLYARLSEYADSWATVMLCAFYISDLNGAQPDVRVRGQSGAVEVGDMKNIGYITGAGGDQAILECLSCLAKVLSSKGELAEEAAEYLIGVASVSSWVLKDIGEDWKNRCNTVLLWLER